jgi:2,4-dienoyl-CoA reductase-like NADH-dependent reductase (Old Yellow Enzyme family)/thioredoxin reductase
MTSNYADEDGMVTDRLIDFFAERAAGGVGLIIVEATYVSQNGRRSKYNINVFDDRFIPGLARLTSAVKRHGARVALQIAHGGRECRREVTGEQPVAPSAVSSAFSGYGAGEQPRILSLAEIEEMVVNFAKAAVRAKEAGFDLVEIHGAHGYLISQFLSANTNFRTDRYGGGLEGRARLLEEVVLRCKEAVGPDMPVTVRLNASDYTPGGLTLEESLQVGRIAERAGADALHVSAGVNAARPYMMIPGMDVEKGCNVKAAARFKEILNIPVIVAGRINDPLLAEYIIKEGKADMVSVGRGLIADPEWIKKTAQKDFTAIRKCIGCNEGCIRRLHEAKRITCAINAAAGREAVFMEGLRKAPVPKKVAVAGGGPAGMEAARVAAIRGHRVTLYEEQDSLGGLLKLAAIPPRRSDIGNLVGYYQNILPRLGVEIRLKERFTPQKASETKPDAVILATGGKVNRPPVPGLDLPHVAGAFEIIKGEKKAGQNCAVVGGGLVGIETAEILAEQGKRVILIEMFDINLDAPRSDIVYYTDRLEELQVELHPKTRLLEVTENGLLVEEKGWKKMILDVDTVVIATGLKPDSSLADEFRRVVPEVYAVGDCQAPGKIINAVHAAAETALTL